MKKISGKWAVNPDKLASIFTETIQPISFKISDKNYQAIKIGSNSELRCYTDIWNRMKNDTVSLNLNVADKYHNAEKTYMVKYNYPVFYGAANQIDEVISSNLEKQLVENANFEVMNISIPKDKYLWICIPEAYDTGELLFTINDAFGGIDFIESKVLEVNGYVPVTYNLYRSTNHSLGDLHIIVTERGLNPKCLFM